MKKLKMGVPIKIPRSDFVTIEIMIPIAINTKLVMGKRDVNTPNGSHPLLLNA